MEQPSPNATPHISSSGSQEQPGLPEQQPPALEPLPSTYEDLISTLQTLLASTTAADSTSQANLSRAIGIANRLAELCPICYHPMMDPETTSCNHTFCKECLQTWLSEKATCPTCRRIIRSASGPVGPGVGVMGPMPRLRTPPFHRPMPVAQPNLALGVTRRGTNRTLPFIDFGPANGDRRQRRNAGIPNLSQVVLPGLGESGDSGDEGVGGAENSALE